MTDPALPPTLPYATAVTIDRPQTSSFRWAICALLFMATTINYMDRQILGILSSTLRHDIGWNDTEYSYIVMAFQASYAIGLICSGWAIDRFGTRAGYSCAILFWSVAAAGHALARGVVGFGIARFGLGLGEAGNFPAAIKTVAEWFPKRERAFATGLFNAGSNIGAVIAPIIVPPLALYFGWQVAFIVLGVAGLLWLVAWLALYSSPEQSRFVSAVELEHIRSDGDSLTPIVPPDAELNPRLSTGVSWSKLFTQPQTWAYIIPAAIINPIWWFYLFWLPEFFTRRYHLDLKNLGWPLVAVYSMAMVGSIGGGWLSSMLIARGSTAGFARKMAMFVSVLCVVPVCIITRIDNILLATFVAGLATLGHQSFSANLYTMGSDLFPRRAVASVVGLGTGAGSLLALVFSYLIGKSLETTGSYAMPFIVAGLGYPFGWFAIMILSPRWKPVDPERL